MSSAPSRQQEPGARRARERGVWRLAFLASVAFHVLLFLTGPLGSVPLSPFSAAGPEEGDQEAPEGLEVVALSSAPPDPAQVPAVPVLDVELPEPEVVELDASPEVEVMLPEPPEPGTGASEGTDPDDLADAGAPEASGAGDGGREAEGVERVVPPTPRGIIMPPTNRNLRGQEVEVWVFVDDQGQVVPDSTHLRPPTGDRSFDEQLTEEASDWVFDPAREGGSPVAAWFPYTISM